MQVVVVCGKHGILLSVHNFTILKFSHSDWATNVDDHKSSMGFYVYLGVNIIPLGSNKRKVVSTSTIES